MLTAKVRITEVLTIEVLIIEILTTDALTIEIRITEALKIRVPITEAPETDARKTAREAVLRITEEETDAARAATRVEARTENAARVKEDRADVPREALTADTAITVHRRTGPRRAEDRVIIPRAIILREEVRVLNVLLRDVLTDRAEEAQIMEDRPTTGRMALRDLQDLALTVIKVTAAVEAAARAVAAASAVTAAITEAMAGREIDSEVSQRLKALWQRLRPRILKRSVRKKRGASVRKRISATGRI